MRHCKIDTWILILSIIYFALGAPAAVRESLEMSVDVDVVKGRTATSQKRFDSSDEWSTTDTGNRPATPQGSIPSDLDRLFEEVADPAIDWYIPPPDSPESSGSVNSNRPNNAPLNPTGSHAGPAGGSPLPHPGPLEDSFPSTPGRLVNLGTLSSTGHQPTPPQSPTGDSQVPPPPPPPPHPSDEHPPSPAASLDMDTLSSTGHQPTPPQSPEPDSGVHAPSNPVQEPQPSASEAEAGAADLLSKVFNGKIKPRISRSGSMSR